MAFSLRLTYEDEPSSNHDTYFLYEDGGWKHPCHLLHALSASPPPEDQPYCSGSQRGKRDFPGGGPLLFGDNFYRRACAGFVYKRHCSSVAVDLDALAGFDAMGGIARAHNGRNTVLSRYDRAVGQRATDVGDQPLRLRE